MNIIKVTPDNNVERLEQFISKIGTAAKSFRYYDSRPVTAIRNHLITLLLIKDEIPVAYGHLDRENDDVWLGICVSPEHQSGGYGKTMMNALLEKAMEFGLSQIVLTVDKDNFRAIRMYEQMNFHQVGEGACHYKYKHDL